MIGMVVRRIVFWLVMGSIAVALFRVFPWDNPNAAWAKLSETADGFAAWANGIVSQAHLEDLPQPAPLQLPGEGDPAAGN